MKHRTLQLALVALLLLQVMPSLSQSVNEMKKERTRIEKQIAESKKMLASTEKDAKGQISRMNFLSEQIRQQQKLMNSLDAEVKAVSDEMKANEERQHQLEQSLEERKQSYARALRLSRSRDTFEKRLTFLFSAESFRQMYRRARYLREYSDFQVRQAQEIQQKQQELTLKQQELATLRTEKQALLARQQQERDALATQKGEQQALVKKLQKKQADIKKEISRQQSEYNRLDKEIDRLIAEQIAASQKKSQESTAKGSSSGSFKMSEADIKLSGSFAANKGKLPVPVLGPYMLTAHYGVNQVEGMKDVKVNNQGVDIRCGAGATIRCIFEGEVSAVFLIPTRETYGVLVRHGEYISVYCNLATLNIKQGDKVKLNTVLGTAGKDASGENIVQFQLRKNQQRLNPEEWIRF